MIREIVWMRYDPSTLEPTHYNLFGLPMAPVDTLYRTKRDGFVLTDWLTEIYVRH
jgi:hypothetical protein